MEAAELGWVSGGGRRSIWAVLGSLVTELRRRFLGCEDSVEGDRSLLILRDAGSGMSR